MRTLGRKDIEDIISFIVMKNENLNNDLFVGKGKDRKVVVKSGLKIKHIASGLVYTVKKISADDSGKPVIVCSRPGKRILITSDEFKQYERQ